MKIALRIVAGIVVAGITAWAAGAIYYAPVLSANLRAGAAVAFVLAVALAFIFLPNRRRTLAGFLGVVALLVLLFFQIPASNDRDWQPEVAVTPWAEVKGDRVTIHGVRNFDYRTESDFDARWEDRTYDLSKLDSADVIAVYWAGKTIAHVMLSFGFQDKDYLAVSIETRKAKGQSYSTLAGFFRNYELIYIPADERDVVRVRSNYREPQEQVYIYRTRAPQRNIRRVFLDYIKTMNAMRERPGFYNTLTTNCTTSILTHTKMNPESPPLSWKILLSGYVPQYLYEKGRIDTSMPFAELEKISLINGRAHAADKDPNFSRRIREGLPKPAPLP
ncbi:MAG TPA: DUF4105 domain-containing protein [Candidatus Binatia bacterium]|jgi:hypothetical protein